MIKTLSRIAGSLGLISIGGFTGLHAYQAEILKDPVQLQHGVEAAILLAVAAGLFFLIKPSGGVYWPEREPPAVKPLSTAGSNTVTLTITDPLLPMEGGGHWSQTAKVDLAKASRRQRARLLKKGETALLETWATLACMQDDDENPAFIITAPSQEGPPPPSGEAIVLGMANYLSDHGFYLVTKGTIDAGVTRTETSSRSTYLRDRGVMGANTNNLLLAFNHATKA